MVDMTVTEGHTSQARFELDRAGIADLFLMACSVALLMTSGYLARSDSPLGVNGTALAIGWYGLLLGFIGFYRVRLSVPLAALLAGGITALFLIVTRTEVALDGALILKLSVGLGALVISYRAAVSERSTLTRPMALWVAIGAGVFVTLVVAVVTKTSIGFNVDLLLKLAAGMLFGLGMTQENPSRYTSIAAAAVGISGVLYFMDIYMQACIFTREMTVIFWVSALATGGLLAQVTVSRATGIVKHRATALNEKGERVRIRSRVATGSLVLYSTMIVLSIIAVIPFIWMISTSFMTLGETINRSWVPGEMQVCNYYEAWQTARFNIYFGNSIIIALVSIIGLLAVSILAAYAFAKIPFTGRNVVFTLLLATLMVPDVVVMIPNYLVVAGNVFAIPIGKDVFPFIEFGMGRGFSWLDELSALTIPFMGSAFSIFMLRQFFVQIPNELWEAARIDGAGHLRFLLQVVIPISRPPILTVSLLTFIASWNSLLWPLLVTTDPVKWRPIAYGLQAFSDEAGTQLHLLMAGAFITILPMLLLYFVTQKSFTEGIATTGLKG